MAEPRYVTAARFRELLERDGGAEPSQDPEIPTSWSDEQLSVFLVNAESEFETRIAGRYRVPLTHDPVLPVVVQIVVGLAGFEAMSAMRKSKDYETELDPYFLRRRNAVELMDKLASGEAVLPPPPGGGSGGGVYAPALTRDRLFTPGDVGLVPGAVSRVTGISPWPRR